MNSLSDSVKHLRKDALMGVNVGARKPDPVTDSKPEVMTDDKALRVALTLMRLELKRMAFDRNAYQRYGARYPEAVKAHVRSTELGRAMETLERLRQSGVDK